MYRVARPELSFDFSDYRDARIVEKLHEIFYGKCYLCEDKDVSPQIDHFIPQSLDGARVNDWNNLYYACARCNSIKADRSDLIDCCDETQNVSDAIKCLCPSVPSGDVIVEAQIQEQIVINTAELLDKCYNDQSTAHRGITRESLHERIFEKYALFIRHRMVLKDSSSTQSEKSDAKAKIKEMTEDKFPFSIFWKWHVKCDRVLSAIVDK
jgi:hypothetical protein